MENMSTGFGFMIIGMSGVFLFLVLLVIVTNVSYAVIKQINKFFPEKEAALAAVPLRDTGNEVAAAIAAAYSMKNKG